MAYIKPIFGHRGTDKLPYQTSPKCPGSGLLVVACGGMPKCPRCLRHVMVSPKARTLRSHTV